MISATCENVRRKAVFILFTATIAYISAIVYRSAENRSACGVCALDGALNDGTVSNTIRDGKSPLGPFVPLIDLIAKRNFEISSSCGSVSRIMLNTIRRR